MIGPSVVIKLNAMFHRKFGFANTLGRDDLDIFWQEALAMNNLRTASGASARDLAEVYHDAMWLVFENQTPPESYHEAGRRAAEDWREVSF